MLTHIARDCRTNEVFQLFTDNPRRELQKKFNCKTSEPLFKIGFTICAMYVDSEETFQIGLIVAGRWLEIYSLSPMRQKVVTENCQCCCHYGGFVCKQPCDKCNCIE